MARKPKPPRPPRTLQRTLVTPEGVTLSVRLGTGGARAGAVLLDALFMLLILIGTMLLVGLAASYSKAGTGSAYAVIGLLGFFLLRNFYFVLHEAGGRAATPGKRVMKLRVVSRDGGRLTASAVLARNLMREIELFLPPIFLIFASFGGTVSRWTAILGFGWVALFAFFPLFNRDRMRAGDIIAGTWVVEREARGLDHDVLDQASGNRATERIAPFSADELDAYGIFELQRLEDVLRRADRGDRYAVAAAIRRKLGRPDDGEDLAFLESYYTALRAHLERRLLFGHRKADKHDRLHPAAGETTT